ncbi:MAG: triose-phosphate isomerase [Magnetococcus sp. WYHC-3]
MRRRVLIVGNWKMNGLVESAMELVDGILAGLREREANQLLCEVAVCPPFTALGVVNQRIGGSSLKLGAQNMNVNPPGAHTGEVCGLMLRNVGCRYVILGHSERRAMYGDTDDLVAAKVAAAFRDGLSPIVCVGETLQERDAGHTLEVVTRQLKAVIPSLPADAAVLKQQPLVLAYEPVWAIGTGRTATPEQAQEVHAHLRARLAEFTDADLASRTRILYGGSMKPSNAGELMSKPDVDGGLIGGAALTAKDFLGIIDGSSKSAS